MKRFSLLVAASAILVGQGMAGAGQLSPGTTDAAAIMRAVEKRDIGKSLSAYAVMKISPTGGQEVSREMKSMRLHVGDAHRRVVMLAKPMDVRNIGLLIHDYEVGEKPDDQWLYLPSIKKTTRIVASDKASAFLGSDFSYSDMTLLHANQYDFKLTKASATVQGEECWLVEGRPKNARVRDETGYVKSEYWVSKSKLMVVQQRSWIAAGKKMKLMKFEDIRKEGNVWVAHRTAARTLSAAGKPLSTSVFELSDVQVNASELRESDFTHKRIEKGL